LFSKNNTTTKENGFALVELLIAILLLSFGALAMVQLMAAGIKLNIQAKDDTQAATLAQWKIETLAGVGYQSLDPGGDLDTSITDYTEKFIEPTQKVEYIKNWKIVPCGSSTHTDPTVSCDISEEYAQTPWYEITVRVYCNRLDSVAGTRPREVTVKTILLQPF